MVSEMTEQEATKACVDGIWLLYDVAAMNVPICLVKITSFEYRGRRGRDYEIVYIKDTDGIKWPTRLINLRPATPNDMLKYGD